MYKKIDMYEVFSVILKNGIKNNSRDKQESFGKITATHNKEQLYKSQGIILETMNDLMDHHESLSHFTPNVFKTMGISKEGNTYGHRENNLKQINTLVVDFDNIDKDTVSYFEIMYASYDESICPTMILDTPKGYQAYFVLDKPIYIKRNGKALNVAKRFSENIREYFNEKIPGVDLTCNHFGYFRIPKENDILYFDSNYTISYSRLMEFSTKYDIKHKKFSPNSSKVVPFKRLKNINEPWFHNLLNVTDIHGTKGMIGRDNAIFTLSLQMFASKCKVDECLKTMKEFNNRLTNPLKESVVEQKVKSAYSGAYSGPALKYIMALINEYCNPKEIDFGHLFFRKHSKKRENRVRSHYSEWKQDIESYIDRKAKQGYVKTTTKALCEDLGIPRSTLYKVLKEFNTFIWSATKGKYATITITTLKVLNQYLANQVLSKKRVINKQYAEYKATLKLIFNNIENTLIKVAYESFEKLIKPRITIDWGQKSNNFKI